MPTKKLTPKERRSIIEDAKKGITQGELAEKYGVTKQTAAYYQQKAGVSTVEQDFIDEPEATTTAPTGDSKIVQSKKEDEEPTQYQCAYCGELMPKPCAFCPACGKSLKWQ